MTSKVRMQYLSCSTQSVMSAHVSTDQLIMLFNLLFPFKKHLHYNRCRQRQGNWYCWILNTHYSKQLIARWCQRRRPVIQREELTPRQLLNVQCKRRFIEIHTQPEVNVVEYLIHSLSTICINQLRDVSLRSSSKYLYVSVC